MARREYEWDETIDGKVIPKRSDPTNHNMIKGNLTSLFINHLWRRKTPEYFSGVGVFLTDRDIYMPDGALVMDPRKRKPDGVHGAPDLVIEILSYRTARYDRGRKRDIYEQCGVSEYWIISPEERSIERYLLRDGKFALDNVYYQYPKSAFQYADPEELPEMVTEFHCDALPELPIRTDYVFERVMEFPFDG